MKCVGIIGQGKKLSKLAEIYGIEKNDNEGFMIRDEDGNVKKAKISDIENLFEEESK